MSVVFIDAVIPNGAIDGNNTSFTLDPAPNPPESLILESDSSWLVPGVGFTLSGGNLTLTAPPKNSLVVWYRISSASGGNIIVNKFTNPVGAAQSFNFNPSWGAAFQLVDGGSQDSGNLPAGTYSVTEDTVAGWTVSFSQDPSLLVIVDGQTTVLNVTNTFVGQAGQLFTLNTLKPFDFSNPNVAAINSTYVTYGFVNAAKASQNPLLGFHRKRFSEIQMYIKGSGQETTTLFPNYILKQDLTFNPYAYVIPPIVLQTDPPDDIVRPVNVSGNRIYVMYSTNAVGAGFALSKTILVGVLDAFTTVNPNSG